MKKKKKWFLIIVIIIVVIVSGVLFIKHQKGKVGKISKPISTIKVEKGMISIKIEETGEIQPINEVDIKSKISGKVIKLYVKENDYVKEGQLIADIEPDYNQARTIANIKNELKISEIRLRNAEKNFNDTQSLYKKNFVSQQAFDDAKDELEKATLDFKISKEQYDLIKELDSSENVSKIYSTASGTVIERKIEEGEMVTSSTSSYSEGTVLIKVADLTQMLVKSTINEVDIAKIHLNQLAEIKIDAFPYDKFSGKITKISAKATSENNVKVFSLEISIDQKDTRLKPGLTANITIIGEKKENILTIPIRAIFSDNDGNDIVYYAVRDSIGKSQIIKTGINDLQKVEVIEGLKAGDTISLEEPSLKGNKVSATMSFN